MPSATGEQNPITANLPNRLLLEAGAMWKDWQQGGEALLGATRGGAEFTYRPTMREVEVDGLYGPTKGLRRAVRHEATLRVTFVELANAMLEYLLRTTKTSDGTHWKYIPNREVLDAHFATNVALVAEAAATQPNGQPYVIVLNNALADSDIGIRTEDSNEGLLTVEFSAHFTLADQATVPVDVYHPIGAS